MHGSLQFVNVELDQVAEFLSFPMLVGENFPAIARPGGLHKRSRAIGNLLQTRAVRIYEIELANVGRTKHGWKRREFFSIRRTRPGHPS